MYNNDENVATTAGVDDNIDESAEELFAKADGEETKTDTGTIDLDTDHWMDWNHTKIYNWILSLDNGLFIQYKDRLKEELETENLRGLDLVRVEKGDIKEWGVKTFQHKQILYDNIQMLMRNKTQGDV